MEGIHSGLAGAQQNIAQELMEEDLKRELERNEAATRMALAKENEAKEAKKRALEAQVMMQAMLKKYEDMKTKLDGAKLDLQNTSTRIQHQEEVTEKIQSMKDRIEAYANRKEAVDSLQGHVQLKFDLQHSGLDFLHNMEAETAKFQQVQKAEEEKAARVKAMQEMMKEREKAIEKTDKIKVMLERQLEIGEKRAAEQNRIASVREKLLELKMKELELQKAKLARKKKEQEEKEKATEDFIAMIDKQLEHMEANVNPVTGTIPKQMKLNLEAMGERLLRNKTSEDKSVLVEPVEAKTDKTDTEIAQTKSEEKKETPPAECKEEPKEPEKEKTPEANKSKKNKKNKKNKNKSRKTASRSQSRSAEVKSPKLEAEPEKDIPQLEDADTSKETKVEEVTKVEEKVSEKVREKVSEEEEVKAEEKLTEEEVKEMVAKVEGKCKNIKDNIADMAMSEQYLRTKQAMLKAKKKEQEMKIAQRMAELREEEVLKMREKVARMQELLASRKTELKITEEIIHEKDGEKDNLEKRIEASRRRESYVEKKIVEKVMFEKPTKKK